MEDKIIYGIVVLAVVAAHVWIYKWVRFKIDEGVIARCLQESEERKCQSSEAIASTTDIAINRVATVCKKSKLIQTGSGKEGVWCLK